MYQPRLVGVGFYRRPVAERGEAEAYAADIASIMGHMSRGELLEFVGQKMSSLARLVQEKQVPLWLCPSKGAFTQWQAARLTEREASFFKRWWMRRSMRRLQKELGVRSTTCYYQDQFIREFEWHDYEGSRYPARYEPVYCHMFVAPEGELYVWHDGRYVVLRQLEDLSERELAAFYRHFH